MSKLSERHIVIGGLFFFALWIYVALPFFYATPSRNYYEHANACSTDEGKNHGFWEKASCDPTAYFTLWLVAFTGVLAVSTIGLWIVTWRAGNRQSHEMQASIAVANAAAHAAGQSAFIAEQTLFASERPCVLLEVVDTTNLGLSIRRYPSMTVKFVNHGNSPALMKHIFIELLHDPATEPSIAVSNLPTIYEVIAAGGETDHIEVPVKNVPATSYFAGDDAKRLVLHGYLKYGDILEAMHTHHIYLRAGADAKTWTEEGGTSYNYRQTQLPHEAVEITVK